MEILSVSFALQGTNEVASTNPVAKVRYATAPVTLTITQNIFTAIPCHSLLSYCSNILTLIAHICYNHEWIQISMATYAYTWVKNKRHTEVSFMISNPHNVSQQPCKPVPSICDVMLLKWFPTHHNYNTYKWIQHSQLDSTTAIINRFFIHLAQIYLKMTFSSK